ncbi:MAG: hypothetical protein JXM70_12750, partial [Pirellulales bacterium]|nr:hypothetical protein [Pirellulales bacterium]
MASSSTSKKKPLAAIGVGLCIVALVAVAVVALLKSGSQGKDGKQLPKRFSYDIQALREIDPALIKFEEKLSIPVEMEEPKAIAAGPLEAGKESDQKIYVGGDRSILVFEPDGKTAATYPLKFEPRALAVTPKQIYVAAKSYIAVLDKDGGLITTWSDRGERAVLTSIAVDPSENESGGNDIYVADAGNRIVLRYDSDGKLLGKINRLDSLDLSGADPKASRLGFIIPSPF